jgi:predicted Zn-dependent peptidase
VIAALLAWCTAAHAGEAIPFQRYELPNGLQVLLHPDRSLPQVVVDVWYRVGSKDEVAGRSGFAHLFEHLMFMGTDRLPGNGFDAVMEAYGGSNNAWTMEDATNYHEGGPPNLLETFLWMEADRMDALGRAMTQQKLDLQRDVVRNERRQSYEDQPYGVAWLAMPEMLYPKGHPYAHTVIGTHEDLQNASVADVKDFFATWYVPNNASLVVAGDFDPEAVKPMIARYFGSIPSRTLPARPAVLPVTRVQRASLEVRDDVQFPQVDYVWHTPAAFSADDAALQLVASLLGDGESSRLYRALVATGLAQEVEVQQMPTQLGSTFVVVATAMEGVPLARLERALHDELESLANTPPSPEELARVQAQFELGLLEELEGLLARATRLNQYWAYTGDPGFLAKDLARFRDVDAAQLSRVTATYLVPDDAARIVVMPEVKPVAGKPAGKETKP